MARARRGLCFHTHTALEGSHRPLPTHTAPVCCVVVPVILGGSRAKNSQPSEAVNAASSPGHPLTAEGFICLWMKHAGSHTCMYKPTVKHTCTHTQTVWTSWHPVCSIVNACGFCTCYVKDAFRYSCCPARGPQHSRAHKIYAGCLCAVFL